jgi:hypothetical protein
VIEKYKRAIALSLQQRSNRLEEAQRALHFYAFRPGGREEIPRVLEALRQISKDELLAAFMAAFAPAAGKSIAVYLYQDPEVAVPAPHLQLIDDVDQFRQNHVVF